MEKYSLKFKKVKAFGNVRQKWEGYVEYKIPCIAAEIKVFKKGEYCINCWLFPRSEKTGLLVKTKSLEAAKNKINAEWDKFVKHIIKTDI